MVCRDDSEHAPHQLRVQHPQGGVEAPKLHLGLCRRVKHQRRVQLQLRRRYLGAWRVRLLLVLRCGTRAPHTWRHVRHETHMVHGSKCGVGVTVSGRRRRRRPVGRSLHCRAVLGQRREAAVRGWRRWPCSRGHGNTAQWVPAGGGRRNDVSKGRRRSMAFNATPSIVNAFTPASV